MPTDPLEERARTRVGSVLRGKYRIDRVLGIGGMAVVYKATHRNQAEFAIKMLHPELSLHEDIRKRFLREGYAANSVRHPGVVRIVDDDVAEDGAAFLVMDLLDGIPCDKLVSEGERLPLDVTCAIAYELLDILAAAHAQGIVHRDVKPANLFLLRSGTVTVLDFGIARVRDTMGGGAHVTGTGMLLGTPAFMAPEQAVGKASDIDARTDIWAVGATIFVLAGGQNVHDAETAPQLIVKLATEQARSFGTVAPDAPPGIAAVVDRALTLDKTKRWTSAAEMRAALGHAAHAAFGSIDVRSRIAGAVAMRAGAPAVTPSSGVAPATWHTPAGAAALTPPSSPDTDSPVASERRAGSAKPRARRAKGAILAVGALGVALAAAGVGLALRGVKPTARLAPAASLDAIVAPSASASAVTSAAATTVPSTSASVVAVMPPPAESSASAPHGPPTAAPSRGVEPPRRQVPPSRNSVPQPTPASGPSHPAPLAQPPAAASPSPPSSDPLDGRR